ncbi:hypothetical protein [Chryseobacterium oryzae]|uniref:Uncharacterized protein n=1 Tax=Chryseobacterium oryzae TaxID=2929799 RepID=A0ABY4BGD3_9FLAO|nr:hypothetical protein [Chryseobacterium oryzae]UOE38130.1 hypothetical protein MTP08_13915 [Chryseobacterium oryzae]
MKTTKLFIGTLIFGILIFCSNYFLFNEENEISVMSAALQSLFSSVIFFVLMYFINKKNNNESTN